MAPFRAPPRRRLRPLRRPAERKGAPGRPHDALRRQPPGSGRRRPRAEQPGRLGRRPRHLRRRLRLQLARALLFLLAAASAAPIARADDRADFSTTWYLERRKGGQGGLSVVHPQADVEVDAGDHASIGLGYSADVVSGATAAVFTVDATTSATPFDDTRHEGRLSLGFRGQRSALVLSGGAGVERDYTSIIASAAGNVDLPGKNTNLALSYTHNFDHVCDRDNEMATALERRALTGVDPCA